MSENETGPGAARLPRWQTLSVERGEDYGLFRVERLARVSPRTGHVGQYKVLRIASWANVVALTPDREVVLIEQYRHGIDDLTLEIPGGVVEPGEDPLLGAARELREETGYAGDEPILIGKVHPNPAIQDNVCYTYLIENARLVGELQLDPGEHIAVRTVPLEAVPRLLREGLITHSLVVAAFHWLDLRFAEGAPPGEADGGPTAGGAAGEG